MPPTISSYVFAGGAGGPRLSEEAESADAKRRGVGSCVAAALPSAAGSSVGGGRVCGPGGRPDGGLCSTQDAFRGSAPSCFGCFFLRSVGARMSSSMPTRTRWIEAGVSQGVQVL